ncbi:MAG: hypothetical protein ACJAQ4_002697 [Cryomorphaceae bacterium]
MKSFSYILVISAQNDCTDVIKKASLERINESNVLHVDEPAEGMSVLNKVGLVDSKLPVCIFLSTDIDSSKIKTFLDHLDRDYPEVTKGKVVLVNPRLRLNSLMKFAMSAAVSQFINCPVLPIEVEAVLKA